MLRETPKSLRLYFAFLAVLSLLPIAKAVVRGQFSDLVSWSTLVDLTLTVYLVYIVIRFEQLLRQPIIIKVWLIASMSSAAGYLAASLGSEHQATAIGAVILSVLIFVYLMKSITRLSKEVSAQSV